MTRLVLSVNASWNVLNFRRGLIEALQAHGYEVEVMTPPDAESAALAGLGVRHVPVRMKSRPGLPHEEVGLFFRYLAALRRSKPRVFLGFTPKPNVYGSLAAAVLKIPVINNVSGLGTAFIRGGFWGRTLALLYRAAFRRSKVVFFQNPDDRDLFVGRGLVSEEQARILPGSGVDLRRFDPQSARPGEGRELVFLLVARMLRDKGVLEFVDAARRLRSQGVTARFQLLGFVNVDNRTAVTRAEIDSWVNEGVVEFLGDTADVRPFIAAADCVVLPSYREGLPKSLLEAAAMAKPLIASDVPGCRHIVRDGWNGLLCPPRDAGALAEAMRRLASMPAAERDAMGMRGRRMVEEEFDEQVVVSQYLAAVERAVQGRRTG